jgi:hypothetical protein
MLAASSRRISSGSTGVELLTRRADDPFRLAANVFIRVSPLLSH